MVSSLAMAQVGGYPGGSGSTGTVAPKHTLIFSVERDGQWDVVAVKPSGAVVALGADPIWDERPVYYDEGTGRVVIQRRSLATGQTKVCSVRTDGTGLVDLGGPTALQFAEFKTVAYGSGVKRAILNVHDGSDWDVYSVKLDGTERVSLMVTGKNEKAVGVLRGAVVIEQEYSLTDTDLYSVPAEGGPLTTLAYSSDPEHFERPISGLPPEGPAFIYTRVQSGIPQLWMATASGAGGQPISASVKPQTRPLCAGGRMWFSEATGSQVDLFTVDLTTLTRATLAADPWTDEYLATATEPSGLSTVGYMVCLRGPAGTGSANQLFATKWDGSGDTRNLMVGGDLNVFTVLGKDRVLVESTSGASNRDLFAVSVGSGSIQPLLTSWQWEGFVSLDRLGVLAESRTPNTTFSWGYESRLIRLEGDDLTPTLFAARPGFDVRYLSDDGERWLLMRSRDGEGWEVYNVDASGSGERTQVFLSGASLYGGGARLTQPPELFRSL
jgi:hypothetical protein